MFLRRFLTRLVFAGALLLPSISTSWAQVDMGSIPMWDTIGIINQTTLNQSLFGTDYIPDGDEPASVLIKLAEEPAGPATLASIYPKAERASAEALFSQMLVTYGQLAEQLGVDERDLSGAVAAFIAGSWMAYHDRDVSDEDFPTLVRQMRTLLRATPELDAAPLAEKQALYEHFAILGTLMAATRLALQDRPSDATEAAMQAAAASYLEGFTGIAADDLIIDENGLHRR